MTESLEVASKDSVLTVVFTWNGTSTKAYTTSATPGMGEVYQPALAVEVCTNTGTFDDKPTTIELPFGDDFTTFVASGDPLPPIDVVITEKNVALGLTADDVTLTLFKGRVSKTKRNPSGRAGSVRIEALSMKSVLDVPLGIVCTAQCAFTFGGVGCALDAVALQQTGLVVSIGNDRRVHIINLTPPSVGSPLRQSYWRAGLVTRNGLTIVIRQWDVTNTDFFVLRERPPAEWVGQNVIVTPGCDKSIENCRAWDNEEHFGGFGIGMPDYMPVIEG